jgi:short-subunit dehydrogenase
MARASRSLLRTLVAAAAGLSLAALVRAAVRRAHRIDLAGRVAVVTGGSRGLGLLIAEELGRRGARVAICGRDPRALEAATQRLRAQGIEVLARTCDLGSRRQAEDFIEAVTTAWGRIDVLVNNAGVIHVEPAETATLASLDEAMRSNFYAAVHATFAALPALRRHEGARLVNVTSIGGRVAVPHLLGYSASKFALMGFSEGLSAELGRSGVRVVTVVPGLMRTGSYYNAEFAGQAAREHAWFSASASLPLVTVGARRAARRIVRAIERGERLAYVGWPAAVASLAHGIAPRLTMAAMALVDRMLPSPVRPAEGPRRGREIPSALHGSALLALGDRAARANNEEPGPLSRSS